jgi:hypothetical protein
LAGWNTIVFAESVQVGAGGQEPADEILLKNRQAYFNQNRTSALEYRLFDLRGKTPHSSRKTLETQM